MRITSDQIRNIESSTLFTAQIDFEYSPFQHDTVIVGTKGNGKTTRAKKILLTIPNLAFWIWDFSNKFSGFGNQVSRVEDLKYGQYVINAADKSKANFGRFMKKAFDTQKNLLVVVDELHQYTSKNETFMPLYEFVMSGRNKHLSGIYISTRPQAVPNYILTNARHVFAYQMNSALDLDWLHDYLGPEAWLLVTKDRRQQFYLRPEDADALPDFSFIYRDMKKSRPQVVLKK